MFLYWTYGCYAAEILSNISHDFERMNVIHRYIRLSNRQHNMLPFLRKVAVRKSSYVQIHRGCLAANELRAIASINQILSAGTARHLPYQIIY